jgi:hypothetical protein
MTAMEPADPFAGLETADAEWLRGRTAAALLLLRRSATDILELGEIFREVKARVGHGRFTPWVKSVLPFSPDTAQRFMQVAEQFGGVQKPQLAVFAPTALYSLAQPNTPPAARLAALALADRGEPVTYTVALALIREARKPAPDPPPDLGPDADPDDADRAGALLWADAAVAALAEVDGLLAEGDDLPGHPFPSQVWRDAVRAVRAGVERWRDALQEGV